ncbi:MAG: transposase [Thermoguttaceae bacterium]
MLKHPETRLSTQHRDVARQTIYEVCTHRNWQCLAVGVQSNHVHVVVKGDVKPGKILADLKAYATRRLREQFEELRDKTIWAESGSTRNLWNEDSVKQAVQYVQNQ